MRLVALLAALLFQVEAPRYAFLVKPYLQLGNNPTSPNEITLIWHSTGVEESWQVNVRSGSGDFRAMAAPVCRPVAVRGLPPQDVCRAKLSQLAAGEPFTYRVLRNSTQVFEAQGRARHSPEQPYRFAVFGDCGANTQGQRDIAWQAYQAKPDFVLHTGDIVYGRGRISEYAVNYWPMYNADAPSQQQGVPLMRSTLFIAAPGNHDIGSTDVGANPDGLAYFLFWSQPLNGPLHTIGAANTPILSGPDADQKAFIAASRDQYPRMANFSFRYGNAHWTMLDSNRNVDWRDPVLREWLKRDLQAAQSATWRFVAFHHPGFNSSRSHFTNQWMRGLAPVFEAAKVDVVFSGHVHNYQRSFPMKFVPKPDGLTPSGTWGGEWAFDKNFDGAAKTRPDGVVYIVTGAGGARLYNPEQENDAASWQPFTHKFISNVHSLTVADVRDRQLTIRQIAADGSEVDRFAITK